MSAAGQYDWQRKEATVDRTKRIIVALPERDYQRLASVAAAQVREPEQHVQYYIRRALARTKLQEGSSNGEDS